MAQLELRLHQEIEIEGVPHTLVKYLGSGGMGSAFLAQPEGDGPKKVVKSFRNKEPWMRESIRLGLSTRTRVNGAIDGILPKVFEPGRFDEEKLIITEHVEGKEPSVALPKACNAKKLKRAWRNFIDQYRRSALSQGVLLDHGLVHLDLKPRNMADDGTKIRFFDLDFSRLAADDPIVDEDGEIMLYGSYPFLAPEIFKGSGHTATSDSFSVGVTGLTWLQKLFGQKPIRHHLDSYIRMRKIFCDTRDHPQFLESWMQRVPEDVQAETYGSLFHITRCLSDEPKKRPKTSEETRQILSVSMPRVHQTTPPVR